MTAPRLFYQQIVTSSTWFEESALDSLRVASAWHSWLLDRGSLTSRLIQFSGGEFRVNVLSETWQRPHRRESLKLGLPQHLTARIREVELLCNDTPMVFARSIIPLSLYRQEPSTFQGLGSKPLGHLLFKAGRARNRQRSITVCNHPKQGQVYGRATPYQYHGAEILVSEFFINPDLVRT